MSSPKRAARGAVRRATNAASRGGTPKLPAKAAVKTANGTSADAKRLAVAIERGIADGRLDAISADVLQALIAATCRNYTGAPPSGRRLRTGCEKFHLRHRRHDYGQQPAARGRSQHVRARHVARFYGTIKSTCSPQAGRATVLGATHGSHR